MKTLKFLWALIAFAPVHYWQHIKTTRNASERHQIGVNSLQIASKATLIVGLVTSFFFVAPTVYQYADGMPQWIAISAAVLGCLVSAMMIDLPMSALLPLVLDKVGNINGKRDAISVACNILYVVFLACVTMYFSYAGNTHTTAWMMADKKPTATNIVAIDSAKTAAAKSIRKSHAPALAAAKLQDEKNAAEAENITAGARKRAAEKFVYYKTNNWHRGEYNKMVDKAVKDSTKHRDGYQPRWDAANSQLQNDLHQSAAAYQYKIDMAKKGDFSAVNDYERGLGVMRLFFRDLGMYSTVFFIVMTVLVALMSPPSSPAHGGARKKKLIKGITPGNSAKDKTVETELFFDISEIRRHLPQDILRINDTIKWNKDFEGFPPRDCQTTLDGFIQKWENIKQLDPAEYAALSAHYKEFYTKKYKKMYGEIDFPLVYDDVSARAAFS